MKAQEAIQFLKETIAGCTFTKDKQLKEVCEVSIEALEKNDELKAEIEALIAGQETLQKYVSEVLPKFAERIKLEFYREFDELIPSIMADKIDECLKEEVSES